VPPAGVTESCFPEERIVSRCPCGLVIAQCGVRQLTGDFREHETLGAGCSSMRTKSLAHKIRVTTSAIMSHSTCLIATGFDDINLLLLCCFVFV